MAEGKVKKGYVFSKHKTTVDSDGVVLEQNMTTIKVKDLDSFYKSYISHIALTNRLSHSELKLLRSIAAYVDWNDNSISFSPRLNKKIIVMADMTEATRRTTLCRLTAKNFLIKAGRGHYIINPNVFFRGDEVQRANVIKLNYKWEIVGVNTKGLEELQDVSNGDSLIKAGIENLKEYDNDKEQEEEKTMQAS
jgi:hypothetical protein